MAHNIRHINISNAVCAGQERAIEFDADAGTLIIYGVATFEEAMAIVESRAAVVSLTTFDDTGSEPPALGAPESDQNDDPLAETGEFADETAEVPEVEATVEEDTAIYARFTKLKELVAHLKSRGYEDFPAVFAACTELINADLCPILTKVTNLEARIKNTCTLLSIPLENNVA